MFGAGLGRRRRRRRLTMEDLNKILGDLNINGSDDKKADFKSRPNLPDSMDGLAGFILGALLIGLTKPPSFDDSSLFGLPKPTDDDDDDDDFTDFTMDY